MKLVVLTSVAIALTVATILYLQDLRIDNSSRQKTTPRVWSCSEKFERLMDWRNFSIGAWNYGDHKAAQEWKRIYDEDKELPCIGVERPLPSW